MKTSHRRMLAELLSLPTAPLREEFVIAYVRRWASKRPSIRMDADAFGNLRLHLRRGRRRVSRPILLSAHMDHPGFEAVRMTGPRRLHAVWRGGVTPEYFRRAGVRFYSEENWIRGRVRSMRIVRAHGRQQVASVSVDVPETVAPNSIGMWDLTDPIIRGTRIHARGCDDVAGVAAVLAALDTLHRRRGALDVYAMLTRAEEVGFAGAIAACRSGLVPRRARLVAVECSSEIPGAHVGDGPILRVGDRASVFTPRLTAFCQHVADGLAKADRRFSYQRKLMDAGTCESAVFCEFGLEATGLCIALGRYHNMDRRRRRIAAEYIDLRDFDRLVQWLAALGRSPAPPASRPSPLHKRLTRLERRWLPHLKRTAQKVLSGKKCQDSSAAAVHRVLRTKES